MKGSQSMRSSADQPRRNHASSLLPSSSKICCTQLLSGLFVRLWVTATKGPSIQPSEVLAQDSVDRPFPYPCRHGTSFTRTARLPLCPAVIAITTSCRLPIQAHAPDRQLQVGIQFHRYDGQIISGGWALLSLFLPDHQLRLV